MARAKSAYVCAECGASALQWFGSCPSCGAAGTLSETAVEKPTAHRYAAEAAKPVALDAVVAAESERIATGLGELDRALGGGLVPGQVALLGGDPGIGKSTLLLQTLHAVSASLPALYISGEESAEQVALRARRLALESGRLRLLAEKASGKPHPDRRPDVVVFVNGLPLAVFELKNLADTQATLKKAYGQLQVCQHRLDRVLGLGRRVPAAGALAHCRPCSAGTAGGGTASWAPVGCPVGASPAGSSEGARATQHAYPIAQTGRHANSRQRRRRLDPGPRRRGEPLQPGLDDGRRRAAR